MNCPGPWRTTGTTQPNPSRRLIVNVPFHYHEYAGRSLSRREQSLAAAVFPVFTEPLDARNLGLAEHGEELILAPRKVARIGRQKRLDFSCHLSAKLQCSLLNRNAHIDRGVNVTAQYLS